MATSNENIVSNIERKYSVQAIESEASGLFYLQDDERKQLGILTITKGIPTWAILKREQLKTLIKELKDVYDTVFN